jgi:hypothetical protein
MKNNIKTEIPENKIMQIRENSDTAHWSKKYDISAEDLKNKEYSIGIYDKIIESYIQKAN